MHRGIQPRCGNPSFILTGIKDEPKQGTLGIRASVSSKMIVLLMQTKSSRLIWHKWWATSVVYQRSNLSASVQPSRACCAQHLVAGDSRYRDAAPWHSLHTPRPSINRSCMPKVVFWPTSLCFTVTLIVLGPAVSSRLTSCCYVMLNEALVGCISQLKDHALIAPLPVVVWYSGLLPGGPSPPSSTAIILLLHGGLASPGNQVEKQARRSPEGLWRAAPEVFIRRLDNVQLTLVVAGLILWGQNDVSICSTFLKYDAGLTRY